MNEIRHHYDQPSDDDALMHNVYPIIFKLSLLKIANGMVNKNENTEANDLMVRNIFVSTDRHKKLDLTIISPDIHPKVWICSIIPNR